MRLFRGELPVTGLHFHSRRGTMVDIGLKRWKSTIKYHAEPISGGHESRLGSPVVSGAASADCQLRAADISKRYGALYVLRDVSIDIRSGEFLTLLGPSGSGKSTFLMILAGFIRPSRGRLLEAGEDITPRPPEKRNFGMVFQGYSLFPHLSVADNVAFPLRIRRVPPAERRQRVGQILEVVGLSPHAHKRPDALSGGQQQRVAIARALVFEPDILLLDEPLSALDKNLREQLQGELQRIHQEVGTTFVFVTHDQNEALALSSRIAILNDGHLIQIGRPDIIYSRPVNRFVAEFLGSINIFPVQDVTRDGALARGRFGETTLAAPLSENNRLGASQVVAVRPEHMTLHGERPDCGDNAVSAIVTGTVYQGAATVFKLDAGVGAMAMSLSLTNDQIPQGLTRGSQVWLSWPAEKAILLDDAC